MGKSAIYFGYLYPWTLILFILVYMLWRGFGLKRKKSTGKNLLLILGLVLYLVSFYSNYGLQYFMILWLLRDLLIVLLSYVFFRFIAKNKKLVIVVVVATGAIFGYLYYKNGRLPFVKPEATAFATSKSAELLVDISDKNKLQELTQLLEPFQAKIDLAFPEIGDTSVTDLDDYYTIDFENFKDSTAIFEKLNKSGLIDDVEFNEVYTLSPVELPNATFEKFLVPTDTVITQPSDSTLVMQDSTSARAIDSILSKIEVEPQKYSGTALNDPKIAELWAFSYMEIDKLLNLLKDAKPAKKAKIFILDTGVDALHEDIAGNYVSLVKDYDKDTDRHGTHCAGIANAISNNKLGIASLNLTGLYTTVTSITVLPGGSGRQEDIIDGIILAADNGADVISMSLGGPATDKRQRAYEKAIKYANDKGAIVIVAAGNENVNARLAVPACCKGVITVSAVDDKMEKAVFSNDVSDIEYKVSAPGVKIFSTTPNNDYQYLSGTSMATPYVSGLVGIMKAFKPSLTTEEVYRILNSTGKDTKDTRKTGKFIQPLAALSSIDTKSTTSSIKQNIDKFFTFKPESIKN